MKSAIQIALLALLVILGILAARLAIFVDHADVTLTTEGARFDSTMAAISQDEADIRALAKVYGPTVRQKIHDYDKAALTTMREVTLTSGQLRHASVDERKELTAQNTQITNTVTNLAAAIKNTDTSLNGKDGVLAGVTSTLAETKSTVAETNKSIRETNASLNKTIGALADTISGPEIKDSLVNFDKATANLAIVSQNAVGITSDAKEAADYALAELKKPVKKLKAFGEFMARLAGDLLHLP